MSSLGSCLERSTAHGISHAARSTSSLKRAAWLFSFLMASCLFIYYFRANMKKYFAQPTSVTIEIGGTKFIAPDIHMCNFNPLAKSRLVDPWTLQNSSLLNSLREDIINLETRLNTFAPKSRKSDFFWSSLPREKLFAAVGHLMKQTVLVAEMDSGVTIKPENMEINSNANYFSCFRVKNLNESGFNSTSSLLNLHLYTDSFHFKKTPLTFDNKPLTDYDFTSSPSVMSPSGILLIFTPPGEYPHLESHSVLLSPGRYTTIKLRMQKTISANTRHDPCEERNQMMTYYNPLLGNNVTTNYRKSLNDCKYRKIMEKLMKDYEECQCIPYILPVSLTLAQKYPICGNFSSVDNQQTAVAMENQLSCRDYFYYYDTEFDMEECRGEKPCETVTYTSDVSSTDWPLLDDIETILEELLPLIKELVSPLETPGLNRFLDYVGTNSSMRNDMTKYNFARAMIGPGETKSLRIVEKVSYGLENLVSDIGGLAGLCLGVSFLTILELLDLIYDCLRVREIKE